MSLFPLLCHSFYSKFEEMDPRFPSPFIPAPAKIRYKRSSSILKQNHDLAVAESYLYTNHRQKKTGFFPLP